VGLLEDFPVCADHECEFLTAAAVRGHLSQVSDEFERLIPRQTARQFAVREVLLKNRQLVMQMFAHVASPLERRSIVRFM
jgi:hypothetical protein